MFSHRIDWNLEENELARKLAKKRAAGERVRDLTSSNPTTCGSSYPRSELLACLAPDEALVYEPSPQGLAVARRAVASYYEARGCAVAPESLFLTASTSEAYGYLFKLLCDPGDEVLVPSPSYPLFAFLAALDGVRAKPYFLRPEDDWHIDFASLESQITPRSRAVLAVHPNNPTGSYVSAGEAERLVSIAREHGLGLIVDEVFLDYPLLDDYDGSRSFASRFDEGALVFVLNGLSKLAGLPQLKLAWIAVGGAGTVRDEARLRLEHIADSYLSVATPIQWALPRLLELTPAISRSLLRRARETRKTLAGLVSAEPSVNLLPVSGGWSQVVRLAALESSETWALRFLDEGSVYVHPGAFFGFTQEAYIVVSLLTPGDELREGVRALLDVVSRRLRL